MENFDLHATAQGLASGIISESKHNDLDHWIEEMEPIVENYPLLNDGNEVMRFLAYCAEHHRDLFIQAGKEMPSWTPITDDAFAYNGTLAFSILRNEVVRFLSLMNKEGMNAPATVTSEELVHMFEMIHHEKSEVTIEDMIDCLEYEKMQKAEFGKFSFDA